MTAVKSQPTQTPSQGSDQTPVGSLDELVDSADSTNLVGPAIVFRQGVKYIGGGLHCVSLAYAGEGRGQLHIGYTAVAAAFVDGKSVWQNKDYDPVDLPVQSDRFVLVLAPSVEYGGVRKNTLRFKRPEDTTSRTFLKVVADEAVSVYLNGEFAWLGDCVVSSKPGN
ncbi:hypothetical protein HN587_07160 [Candidatus Woesearchaeota archaeon]|jgi:hypothetical protein|nr:hypothetical protein [Candidatus Woesearchaeota archaeon]